jgi:hypothetical protein
MIHPVIAIAARDQTDRDIAGRAKKVRVESCSFLPPVTGSPGFPQKTIPCPICHNEVYQVVAGYLSALLSRFLKRENRP